MSLITEVKAVFDCHTPHHSTLFTPTMGPGKLLKESLIEVICALVTNNKSSKETAANIGILLTTAALGQTLRRVIYNLHISQQGLNEELARRGLVEVQPGITSWQIKKNLCLLEGMVEQTVR